MNELVEHKSWMQRNRIWFIPIMVLTAIIAFMFFSSGLGGKVKDVGKAYADTSLYDNAMLKVKNNSEAINVLGEIKPTDNFAIAEGYVKYSEDNKEVRTTIRIKGTKQKGKLDIYAERKEGTWNYKELKIRIKSIDKTILILENKN